MKYPPLTYRAFPFIILTLLGILFKAPALLMVVVVALIILGAGSMVSAVRSPEKQKAVGAPLRPKVVNIPGIGKIEWITDPLQLDHKQLLSVRDLKKLRDEVMSDPAEWTRMGEKVAISEAEAENKPEFSYMPSTGHPWDCRCQRCWEYRRARDRNTLNQGKTMVVAESDDFEIHAVEQEEPIASYRVGSLGGGYGDACVSRDGYAKGGIVSPKSRFVDLMQSVWM